MADETSPNPAPAPDPAAAPASPAAAPAQAPAAAPVFVKRHVNFATLDVRFADGSALPDDGAAVDTSDPFWADLLDRQLVVVCDAPKAAKSKG